MENNDLAEQDKIQKLKENFESYGSPLFCDVAWWDNEDALDAQSAGIEIESEIKVEGTLVKDQNKLSILKKKEINEEQT